MEQHLVGANGEEANASIGTFMKSTESDAEIGKKRESELCSEPSTSADDGISLPIVEGVIYNYKYVSKVKDLPFDDMINNSTKRNLRLPKIYLTGRPFEISFLLDTKFISERDLWVDNLGSWAGTMRRPTCKSIRVNALGLPDTKNPYYVVRKKYGSHPHSDPPLGLMKCLCYLTRDGRATGNALLSYKCLENCNLRPRPHGNNKHNQNPYMRTYPSTLQKIKERLGSQSPSVIWNELSVDSAGGMDAQAALRDRKQVYNARMPWRRFPDSQAQEEVNYLKARVAALEEQNSKLIFTNAGLMQLVNDLRKTKQDFELGNILHKQNNRHGTNDLLSSHPNMLTYSGQHTDDSHAQAGIYKSAEATGMIREQCMEECRMQEPQSVNQTPCFSAVSSQNY